MTTRKRNRVAIKFPTAGGAKQSFKNECDINQIMAKYEKTGLVTHLAKHGGSYGFAPAVDFRQALELVSKSETIFADLPSQVRKRFQNDPGEFLVFCENPDNRSEMALLGLLSSEATSTESPPAQPSDSASAPQAPNPADTEPTHESA